MSIFKTDQVPTTSEALIRELDDGIKPAVVQSKQDLEPFDLGKQAGKRELVDMLVCELNNANQT